MYVWERANNANITYNAFWKCLSSSGVAGLIYLIVLVIVFIVYSVSFIVCVVLCALFLFECGVCYLCVESYCITTATG
jgi:hypothetical protein